MTRDKILELIKRERENQIRIHGYDESHDDEHTGNELGVAAAAYAVGKATLFEVETFTGHFQKFGLFPWKRFENRTISRKTRERQLLIAGAFIVAELERLHRAKDK